MSKIPESARVHLALFLTMMVWGVNLSAVKGLTENLDLLLVASVRMVIASGALAVIAWRWGGLQQVWRFRKWPLLLGAAFLIVYCQQIAFAEGLFRTSATNAALVMALGPAMSFGLESAFFRRPVGRRQVWGILLALAGIAAVILNRPNASVTSAAWGDLWIFASVFAFALGGICIQRLTANSSPLPISLAVHTTGAMMLCLHAAVFVSEPLTHVNDMSLWQWSLAMYSGVFATGLGSIVWSRGIATIGVGRTASYISLVPIFGVCFGAMFFTEALTLWHAIGLIGVICGTALIVRR